jgi:N-acetylmuramoyl-L-alanine amidase
MSSWIKLLGLVFSLVPLCLAQASEHPLRVLLVPGHDPVNSGAYYSGTKEADLNLKLGYYLFNYLNLNPDFKVFITRDFNTGEYNKYFTDYFDSASSSVQLFRQETGKKYSDDLQSGRIAAIVSAPHAVAADDVAYNLFAINKWANDNQIDLVLHLHFNDYPRSNQGAPGKYAGVTIYVPERQMINAASSRVIADKIFRQLNQFISVSNYKPERVGVVPDQDLIAIGVNNSRKGASVLVEYGYIYEPAIINGETRSVFLEEMAYQTYRGLKLAVGSNVGGPKTNLLPHYFARDLKRNNGPELEALFLQKALLVEKVYPPLDKNLNECPISGLFGPCTELAVTAFQKKYNISATGYVGPQTRAKLNQLYGK